MGISRTRYTPSCWNAIKNDKELNTSSALEKMQSFLTTISRKLYVLCIVSTSEFIFIYNHIIFKLWYLQHATWLPYIIRIHIHIHFLEDVMMWHPYPHFTSNRYPRPHPRISKFSHAIFIFQLQLCHCQGSYWNFQREAIWTELMRADDSVDQKQQVDMAI